MTPAQMLSRYREECDRYGIAAGLDEHAVYRRGEPDKALFVSPHQSDCRDWIEARAMMTLQ